MNSRSRFWLSVKRRQCCLSCETKAKANRLEELEKRLKLVNTENERLKCLLAQKELELAILKELKEKVNPGSRQSRHGR